MGQLRGLDFMTTGVFITCMLTEPQNSANFYLKKVQTF